MSILLLSSNNIVQLRRTYDLAIITSFFFLARGQNPLNLYFQPRHSLLGASTLKLIVGAAENRSLSANQDAELYDFVRQIEICIYSNPSVTIEAHFHSSREGNESLDCAACFCRQAG